VKRGSSIARYALVVNDCRFREIIFRRCNPAMCRGMCGGKREREREREAGRTKKEERGARASGVRFITLIAAVTKLPPDLHTIAFEIRPAAHRRR
jgi:hypothetical protein